MGEKTCFKGKNSQNSMLLYNSNNLYVCEKIKASGTQQEQSKQNAKSTRISFSSHFFLQFRPKCTTQHGNFTTSDHYIYTEDHKFTCSDKVHSFFFFLNRKKNNMHYMKWTTEAYWAAKPTSLHKHMKNVLCHHISPPTS